MNGSLVRGVRVVEFSQLTAAPFCGLTLQDLGARGGEGGGAARRSKSWLGADDRGRWSVLPCAGPALHSPEQVTL